MKMLLTKDYEVFVKGKKTPHFVQRLQLTKDVKQLSDSVNRIPPFQGQGTQREAEVSL